MAIYRVVHGRHTAMAFKEGWYVEKSNGASSVITHLWETWPEAKHEADRLTELEHHQGDIVPGARR